MVRQSDHPSSDLDSDESEDFSDLEDVDETGWRAQRMAEMKAAAEKAEAMANSPHGKYTEIKEERDLMDLVAKTPKAIVHFFHADFKRCAIMDAHLEKLAPQHFETLFLRINVAYVPFLVTKLDIKVLPCVMSFINGAVKDKVTGFEGLTKTGVDSDTFSTSDLQFRLCLSGVIPKSQVQDQAAVYKAMNPQLRQT